MTYNEIFYNERILLANMPLNNEEFKFPTSLSTSIILMQVEYANAIQKYEDLMKDVLAKLKPEGYDEKAEAVQRMEDVDKRLKAHEEWNGEGEQPAKPAEKEIAEADKTRETKEEFDKQTKELADKYNEARMKKAAEDAKFDCRLSREEYEQLVGVIGVTGMIRINGVDGKEAEIRKVDFLQRIAANLVNI